MSSKYYRKPHISLTHAGDLTFSFTMRLLNTIHIVGVKVWTRDHHYNYSLTDRAHIFSKKYAKDV